VNTDRPPDSCQTYVMGWLKVRPRWRMSYMKILKLPFSSIVTAVHGCLRSKRCCRKVFIVFFARSGPLTLATNCRRTVSNNLNGYSHTIKKKLIYRIMYYSVPISILLILKILLITSHQMTSF